ncbi:unnamed protein product, partial [Rotaria magnacalcarata]
MGALFERALTVGVCGVDVDVDVADIDNDVTDFCLSIAMGILDSLGRREVNVAKLTSS